MEKEFKAYRESILKQERTNRLFNWILINEQYIIKYLHTLTRCLEDANFKNVDSNKIVKRMSNAYLEFREKVLSHQDEYQFMDPIDELKWVTGEGK